MVGKGLGRRIVNIAIRYIKANDEKLEKRIPYLIFEDANTPYGHNLFWRIQMGAGGEIEENQYPIYIYIYIR